MTPDFRASVRVLGYSPSQAAVAAGIALRTASVTCSKAATRIFRETGQTKVDITMRQLGTDKKFSYTATRVKLNKPVTSVIDGKTITRKYKCQIKAK